MKLLISGNNALLEIDVLSYVYPKATDFYDSNWLQCSLSCRTGNLTVQEGLCLQTSDFLELQKSIAAFKQNKSPKIEFETMEGQLQFTIQRESRHITVTGTLSALPPTQGIFTFKFVNETFPDSIMESLENILLNFPVIPET